MHRKHFAVAITIAAGSLAWSSAAHAADVTFETGSLIIPMDVDYQDAGMLKAFGLLDKLLRGGVPVQWVIKTPKTVVNAATGKFQDDFVASATDFKTPTTVIASHGYRGGPFVIKKADVAKATPIITAWQAANTTTVHVTTAPFTGNVSRTLTVAPRIAVLGDGNQSIAFGYLNAAGILDEDNKTWANTSVDLLTTAAISGPTTTNHKDGALFRPSGQPAFCEIMTMHWSVTDTDVPEVTAELAQFLNYPVHVNGECQAVNAIEGAPPTGGRSNFVSTAGFAWPAPDKPTAVEFLNSSLPFAQMDGPFGIIGGSEPAYKLGPGSKYYDDGIVMVKGAGVALGMQDVWMTGYANTGKGTCTITDFGCVVDGKALGKVSYLGGHQYDVKTPISANPNTQGTRLFLNSLYEAGCVTDEGQPKLAFTKSGPAETASSTVTYTIAWNNTGLGPAWSVVLKDPIPTGSTFVSASDGGTFAAGVVTWSLGDIPGSSSGSVNVTVTLPSFGSYSNTANATYKVGLATLGVTSNTVTTNYLDCAGDASSCVCDAAACASEAGTGDDAASASDASADGSSASDSASGADASSSSDDTGVTADSSAAGDTGAAADSSAGDDTGAAADSSAGDDTSVGPTDTGSTDVDGAISDDAGGVVPDGDAGSEGGCGCRTTSDRANTPWIGALLALGLVARRRRRAA